MKEKKFLINVAERLASVCDGARTEDGRGYNKYDAGFVRSIINDYYKYDRLSMNKWKSLKNALIKYKGQIEDFGLDYSRIQKMEFVDKVTHDEVEVEIKTNGDTELWIATPYNKQFVNDLKYEIDKHDRKFDWDTKSWIITIKPNTDYGERH